MISRRRLTFQLTPLLDLLLIVIFAQFMDTQETTARIEQQADQRVEQAAQKTEQLSAQNEQAMRKITALSEENAKALRDNVRMEKQASEVEKNAREAIQQSEKIQLELTEQLKLEREQRAQVGELVQELFQLPDSILDPLLDARVDPNSEQTKEKLAQLKKQLQELAGARSEDVIKHFLTYDELTKRSDIWDLYLTENGMFRLKIGEQTTDFRADTPDVFVDRVYSFYKTVPQPKSLVIILFSYGDAKASVRFAATQGLPLVAERMRADSNGRTRFEYAVMGFVPEKTEPAN